MRRLESFPRDQEKGGLADLPSHIREDILNGKGDSEGAHTKPAEWGFGTRRAEKTLRILVLAPNCGARTKIIYNRYGWWAHHDEKEDKPQVATVHGAVNDFRTQILLDTGATVSMISLDLARRLKLKLNSQKRIKVSGLGGIPTYITASTQIKVTLGRRVVYILDVWVTNIGEGVDVLLGMDFMYSAGVRLCIREGTVALPDEESVLMYGYMRNIPITPLQDVHLRPGEHVNVKIRYGECQPLRDVVWASRGDQWVTQVLYGAKSWAVAVKVVTISDKDLWVDSSTPVARIVKCGCFPRAGRFVRPGVRRYQEWQHLIYESTLSTQARMRKERYEQAIRLHPLLE
ncbi:LOW QUALITY PROTEIN: hypothetical protein PHPALM_31926 [Phytophthora palmivora]|uniref:Peptidase A2 domain-containing protein n=1 Tax=Phytophthora palmivora TaxID=4796 RepID=A0A2P4X1E6_9STRA|nr:LOW QUALITY PROTEIN: hypothetical protein PHPALM_31926 [Phytophthora palmivora]